MGQQKHDFHLVNPSIWPLASSLAATLLVSGGLMFMHNKAHGGLVLILGFAAVLYCMYGWWKQVIKEGDVEHAHTAVVRHGLRFGMVLFILSEVMFFFAFFFSFFHSSLFPADIFENGWPIKAGIWPPAGIKTFDPWDVPFLNTLILLLSGTTVTWAHHALLEGNRRDLIRGLALTVALGACFSGLQAYEYHHAAFGFKDGIYASNFYMATGFHGFHVLVGTIFLAVNLLRAVRGGLTPEGHLGFEFAAWYWHFVDVVWLFLFVCVYWLGSGTPAAH